jgi:phage-related minor tail protein
VSAFAQGGSFSNSVVSSPTLFPFADGVGLMGEAGPEAIMPLSRDSSGTLGVKAAGLGGSQVVVNIIESPGQGGQQSRSTHNGVDTLTVWVERIKNSIAGDINQGSGSVPAALNRTYGLNRTVGSY